MSGETGSPRYSLVYNNDVGAKIILFEGTSFCPEGTLLLRGSNSALAKNNRITRASSRRYLVDHGARRLVLQGKTSARYMMLDGVNPSLVSQLNAVIFALDHDAAVM